MPIPPIHPPARTTALASAPGTASRQPHRPAPKGQPPGGARRLAGRLGPTLAILALLGGLGLGGLGCASKPVFEDVPPADELYAEGLEILEGRNILGVFTYVNYDKAIEKFQSIIDNYPYSEYVERAQLQIADAYFADKRYEEALAYYQDFADLHPQHPRVPYTLLQAARCHAEQIQSIERDQSATHQATAVLEELIREHPYAEETREGERMMVELRTRLALNMLEIADFYRERTHWQAAASRYRRVLDEYPGLGLDARALYRLGLCLENMRRLDEALRLYRVVVENYARTPAAGKARTRIARTQ